MLSICTETQTEAKDIDKRIIDSILGLVIFRLKIIICGEIQNC
jgi:hypothetical protein